MLTQEQKQDLFNRAVAGLAAQGFTRAVNSYGGCRYRADNGKRCALGHLIPDDQYSVEIEGGFSAAARIVVPGLSAMVDRDGWNFLSELQEAHDNARTKNEFGEQIDDPESMKANLAALAAKYHLDVPEVLK